MKQEDKELLLKDLSARLPYKPIVYAKWSYRETNGTIKHKETDRKLEINDFYAIWDIKPYLRPMSSMTEEERNEYFNIIKNTIDFYNCPKSEDICFLIIPIDWLNVHHFDYRGLNEKGLALEAPEGMYNIKEQ